MLNKYQCPTIDTVVISSYPPSIGRLQKRPIFLSIRAINLT